MLALLLGGEDLGGLDVTQLGCVGLVKASYTCSGSGCLILKVQYCGHGEMEVSNLRRKRIWIVAAVVGHRQAFRGIETASLE